MAKTRLFILKTKKAEDIKKVEGVAIEVTKEQSIKELGVEMLPNQDENNDFYSRGFYIKGDCIYWKDTSRYETHMDIDVLTSKIIKQFPDIEFRLEITDGTNWYDEYLWDGTEWQKNATYIENENEEWEKVE